MRERAGFTLIELLIVVAIIAILAAIAVPNFLEAQLRAKVSRVKADIRSIAVALEAYAVDNNAYPILRANRQRNPASAAVDGAIGAVTDLTTPVAYMTTVFIKDPFIPEMGYDEVGLVPQLAESQGPVARTLYYSNITEYRRWLGLPTPIDVQWILLSFGPDKKRGPIPGHTTALISIYCGSRGLTPAQEQYFVRALYDPTNGTVSGGDIFMYQGRGL